MQLLKLNPVILIVVTGSGSDGVKESLRDLQIRIVKNENWGRGIGSSIACGARHVSEEVDGLLIALCDQWRVDENDLNRLISVWFTDISRIISASWIEKESFIYSPPALFPRKYIRELTGLSGNQGAKALIAQNMAEVKFVAMENAAVDLDTPADLEQLLRQAGPYPSN